MHSLTNNFLTRLAESRTQQKSFLRIFYFARPPRNKKEKFLRALVASVSERRRGGANGFFQETLLNPVRKLKRCVFCTEIC